MDIILPIASPPWTGIGKKLESMCRKALYEFNLIEGSFQIGVALSGGKDSLTLLYLLHAISGRGFPNFTIHAFHVSGDFSCGSSIDVKFLQKICDHLKIPLTICLADQTRHPLECYSCSRQRRSLIFQQARDLGITTIAFGHHRDDNIQTLLMNLFHKAEFSGILPKVPMHDYGITIIRPLIFIEEEQIRSFAKLYGFARVTCQCPIGQDSLRKQTDKILTEISQTFPNVRENLAQAIFTYGSNKSLRRKIR